MQLLLPKVEFDMHWHENAFTKNDYATISITSLFLAWSTACYGINQNVA